MPDGELNVTLGVLSLSSDAEPSGDIVRAVLADISLSSEGLVLLYGALATALDAVTSVASGGVEITGELAITLGGVSAETFGTSLNGTTAPYEDVISWTGHPLTGSLVRVRTGNLFGIFGEPNEFGLFAGEGWDPNSGTVPLASSQYIRLGSITNEFHNVPINLYDDGDITMQMEPDAPSFAMGNPIPSEYDTGIGLWQGKDTDDIYKWRVGDPSVGGSMLSWDGSSLLLSNSSLDISGATAHIAFGNPPPTSPTSGTGIWIDRTGFYGVNAGVTQIFIDTLDGILYIDGGTEFGVNPLLGDLYVDGILTLGTDGRMQQGTGTWGVDFTGSAIWNDTGVMNIGGWNNNVKQWWGGSDGYFYTAGGNVVMNDSALTFKYATGTNRRLLFESSNSLTSDGAYLAYTDNALWLFNQYAGSAGILFGVEATGEGYHLLQWYELATGDASLDVWGELWVDKHLTATKSATIGQDLVVDGTIKDGSGVEYLKTTGKAADSDKLDGNDSTYFAKATDIPSSATSYTATLVGWSGTPTQAMKYVRIGKLMILIIYISGTSNSTTATATLPSGITAMALGYTQYAQMRVMNAGSTPGSWGMAALSSGSSTISFYLNQSGGGWTNSGTKTIEGTFVFLTA